MNSKLIQILILFLLGVVVFFYPPESLIAFLGMWVLSILSCILAYAIGSIPFGLVLSKLFLKTDIRQIGSGNIGTTNVLRTGNKGLALATLILDAGKGALSVWYLPAFLPILTPEHAALVIAALTLLGHVFPLWLKGKGGKGIATTLGILLVLSWPAALLALATWIGVAFLTRYSSLAALVAAALTPIYAYAFANTTYAIFTVFIAVLLFYCHRDNIKNLLQGTETKIGDKST